VTLATEKKKISAYIEDDLRVDAEKLARVEKRSLSNLVEKLLQEAVDRAKAEGRIGG
jgi:hypothetical protein